MTNLMGQEFFVKIDFQDDEANDFSLAGRCIKVLHGYLCHRELNSIGTSFPAWSDVSVGGSIAFVSTNIDHLEEVINQPSIRFMVKQGLIAVDGIQETPRNNSQRVQYQRCLAAERNTFGEQMRRLKRAMKRAKQRGEVFIHDDFEKPQEIPHHHCIPILSTSTDNSFALYVERTQLESGMYSEEDASMSYSSYGMSSKNKYNGTVPSFTMS